MEYLIIKKGASVGKSSAVVDPAIAYGMYGKPCPTPTQLIKAMQQEKVIVTGKGTITIVDNKMQGFVPHPRPEVHALKWVMPPRLCALGVLR